MVACPCKRCGCCTGGSGIGERLSQDAEQTTPPTYRPHGCANHFMVEPRSYIGRGGSVRSRGGYSALVVARLSGTRWRQGSNTGELVLVISIGAYRPATRPLVVVSLSAIRRHLALALVISYARARQHTLSSVYHVKMMPRSCTPNLLAYPRHPSHRPRLKSPKLPEQRSLGPARLVLDVPPPEH
jgi:hypothetical protein